MSQRLQALYGLKWNPFSPELPLEALYVPPRVENFCWRIENALVRAMHELGPEGHPGPAELPDDPDAVDSVWIGELDPAATWLTDLEPAFADRFPYEPSPYVPDALPGLFPIEPDEPDELMVPAI